jgi:hypothetical protein
MKAATSLPSPSLVETCLPVRPYFSKRPRLSSNVVERRLALVLRGLNRGALDLARAQSILTCFGYACRYRDALTSREVSDWPSVTEWWAVGAGLHTLEGPVRARLLDAHRLCQRPLDGRVRPIRVSRETSKRRYRTTAGRHARHEVACIGHVVQRRGAGGHGMTPAEWPAEQLWPARLP